MGCAYRAPCRSRYPFMGSSSTLSCILAPRTTSSMTTSPPRSASSSSTTLPSVSPLPTAIRCPAPAGPRMSTASTFSPSPVTPFRWERLRSRARHHLPACPGTHPMEPRRPLDGILVRQSSNLVARHVDMATAAHPTTRAGTRQLYNLIISTGFDKMMLNLIISTGLK